MWTCVFLVSDLLILNLLLTGWFQNPSFTSNVLVCVVIVVASGANSHSRL